MIWYEWNLEHSQLHQLLQQLRDDVGGVRDVPLFSEQVDTLRELGRLEYPTDDDKRRVEDLVKSDRRLLEHFWATASSPYWFDLLIATGLVTEVFPDVQYPDGTMSPGKWPAASFIDRIAADRPDMVHRIILAMQNTTNFRVHWILSGLAKTLRGEQLEEVLAVLIHWDGGTNGDIGTGT